MSPVVGQPALVRLGQAEVGDPDDAGGVEQQVRRLDVAVDDPARVGVGQRLGGLPSDLGHAAEEAVCRLPDDSIVEIGVPPGIDGRVADDPSEGPGGRPAGGDRSGARHRSASVAGDLSAGAGIARSRPGRPASDLGDPLTEPVGEPTGADRWLSLATGRQRRGRRLAGVAGRTGATPPRALGRPRSRCSSSTTRSSPWPWMNCIA